MPFELLDVSRNNLDRAASPYLLQHQSNPVHWQMWSGAALEAAARDDKPILLSVGYAACHWCHVMAHESFEDESTAALMNALFLNIKVDREERPDIDQIYMSALHRLGEAGGWPLTMFLTPKGEPFWGGTYFPNQSRFGRPAFADVLRAVEQAYRDRRAEVENTARDLTGAIADRLVAPTGDMTPDMLDMSARRLAGSMDTVNGGFPGSPKFPNSPLLEFLWRASRYSADTALAAPVLLTLRRIIAGGIHDHLGGGFARYSVDERWLVPHFEKMLYDNAQLLELFALASTATGDPVFLGAADNLVAWLEREMLVENAFAASLDADSEGVEGKFYVWTRAEIDALLGSEDAEFFADFYDAGPRGNWTDDHTGLTSIILNQLDSPVATPEQALRLAPLRARLSAAREKRVRPGRDDKILADWNGMMIAALAAGGMMLGKPEWVDLAERAFRFIADSMIRRDHDGLRIAHSMRMGHQVWPGMASDYVMMIRAATFLAEARGPAGAPYLDLAGGLAAALRAHHLAPTGLLTTAADDATDVIARLAPTTDDAVPNPNGVLVASLSRLAVLTGDDVYRRDADAMLTALSGQALANPFAQASTWNGFDTALRMAEIVITGPDEESRALRTAVLALPFLERTVREIMGSEKLAPGHPAAALQSQFGHRGTALICVGNRCSLPLHDPLEIAPTFERMRR